MRCYQIRDYSVAEAPMHDKDGKPFMALHFGTFSEVRSHVRNVMHKAMYEFALVVEVEQPTDKASVLLLLNDVPNPARPDGGRVWEITDRGGLREIQGEV